MSSFTLHIRKWKFEGFLFSAKAEVQLNSHRDDSSHFLSPSFCGQNAIFSWPPGEFTAKSSLFSLTTLHSFECSLLWIKNLPPPSKGQNSWRQGHNLFILKGAQATCYTCCLISMGWAPHPTQQPPFLQLSHIQFHETGSWPIIRKCCLNQIS